MPLISLQSEKKIYFLYCSLQTKPRFFPSKYIWGIWCLHRHLNIMPLHISGLDFMIGPGAKYKWKFQVLLKSHFIFTMFLLKQTTIFQNMNWCLEKLTCIDLYTLFLKDFNGFRDWQQLSLTWKRQETSDFQIKFALGTFLYKTYISRLNTYT